MPKNQSSIVPKEHLPQINNKVCSWTIQPDFSENAGLAVIGILQEYLVIGGHNKYPIKKCEISFRAIEWADPLPLLDFGLILAETALAQDKIIINLGSKSDGEVEHLVFLKFLAQQGFIAAFGEHCQFTLDDVVRNDPGELSLELAAIPYPTHFLHADCIKAKLINVSEFKHDKNLLLADVEKLLYEARELTRDTPFNEDPFVRDVLFQKIRKILFELALNISEHSHKESEQSYAGIYARIRSPKPPMEKNTKNWNKLFEKGKSIFGQRDFSPNPYAEWVELFICDIGSGLTAHINEWKLSKDHEAYSALNKAKKSRNPFHSLVLHIFRAPFSRYIRHDAERTVVTGLQHLGHLLQIGNDYFRIYTQSGSWSGGHLPFPNKFIPSFRDISAPDNRENNKFRDLIPVSGLAYAFSIQPDHAFSSESHSALIQPDGDIRKRIINTLKSDKGIKNNYGKGVLYYDKRNQRDCLPPDHLSGMGLIKVVILRPARLFSKLDLGKWLDLLAGDSTKAPEKPVSMFVLADLTPFQCLAFHELLLNLTTRSQSTINVYLVSENWSVACTTSSKGTYRFVQDKQKSKDFLAPISDHNLFDIDDLAIVLREMDSSAFWKSVQNSSPSALFENPVEWDSSRDKNTPVILQRFLDFPLALVNPDCYHACLRSLNRTLALFPDYRIIAADDLVASLVRDAQLHSFYSNRSLGAERNIVVGSVAVTAGTVNSLKKNADDETVHVLMHKDIDVQNADNLQQENLITVLLWHPNKIEAQVKGIPSWRRITHTPHIAPFGEHSISILRYAEEPDGSLNFNKSNYYARTPEETYNDFQRLGILKSGHWSYGRRHDLLTINIRLAFHHSFIETGPLLSWLKDQFSFLFGKNKNAPPKAQLLLYPSHPVTDMILDRIRQDKNFEKILPEGGMIPTKFIGPRTVSPLLASFLVKHRIEEMARNKGWDNYSVAIFDDGTISGKHLREMSQFVQSLGAGFFTIVLLDRTGLPIQQNVFERFNKKHKRFWRWDVPSLGNSSSCPLCHALGNTSTYMQKLRSNRQITRLREWISKWQVRDVELEWHKGSIDKIPINPPVDITFGVYEDAYGKHHKKRIVTGHSTTATSLLIELSRLTTRTDVALKKAKEVEADNPDVAIEMIATQLFLFMDELSRIDKLERYMELLNIIWRMPNVSSATSMAGLCFVRIDPDMLEDLWNSCLELLSVYKLANMDAILAVNFLRLQYELEKGTYQLNPDASKEEKYNYILLDTGEDLLLALQAFTISLYSHAPHGGNNGPSAHLTEIKARIDELAQKNEDYINTHNLVDKVYQDMMLIENVFAKLKNSQVLLEGEKSVFDLNKLITLLKSSPDVKNSKKLAKKVQVLLYGSATVKGLITSTGTRLFREITKDNLKSLVVEDILQLIEREWEDIVSKKIVEQHAQSDRWLNDKRDIIKPNIQCLGMVEMSDAWIYWDIFIQGVLRDALINVYHASINNEDVLQSNSEFIQDMIWDAKCSGDMNYVVFTLKNHTNNREIQLHQNANIAGLERVGGKIEMFVDEVGFNSLNIAYTKIYIPTHSCFVKGEK